MFEPLIYCFHCNHAFQQLERNSASVPRNVPPFHMEQNGQRTELKSLIQNNKVWNVPSSTNGTGAIRSTPHSPIGSVWKLLGQIKISADAPLRESHPLGRQNASCVPAAGHDWENLSKIALISVLNFSFCLHCIESSIVGCLFRSLTCCQLLAIMIFLLQAKRECICFRTQSITQTSCLVCNFIGFSFSFQSRCSFFRCHSATIQCNYHKAKKSNFPIIYSSYS
jgi:hypothetical protein